MEQPTNIQFNIEGLRDDGDPQWHWINREPTFDLAVKRVEEYKKCEIRGKWLFRIIQKHTIVQEKVIWVSEWTRLEEARVLDANR